jgi:hypothetical protein
VLTVIRMIVGAAAANERPYVMPRQDPRTFHAVRRRVRLVAIVLWAIGGMSLVTAVGAQRHRIPLWAPPVGTTRWVLGSGVLRVEHTFASMPAPIWWLRFDAWVVRSGTWTELRGPRPVGYADLDFPRLAALFLGGAVAASFVALRQDSRSASAALRCTQCGYDLRATPERCPECGKAAAETAGA